MGLLSARAPLALAVCIVGSLAQAGPWDAALLTLPADIQTQFNARCLDGSTPGIYIRKGDPARFKFHIQGGGWCYSASDCAGRAQSILGSNATWTPWLSEFWPPEGAGFYGFEDANATNPWGGYTFVWLTYCDGSSFTSDASGPMTVGNVTIWNRGRANLDAYLALLDRETGFFGNAVDVVVSGTSAGGLATYLRKCRLYATQAHVTSFIPMVAFRDIDSGYIKSRLQHASSRLVALPDAGFFLDGADAREPAGICLALPTPSLPRSAFSYASPGRQVWYEQMRGAMGPDLWNSTLRGGAGTCVAAQAPGAAARCLMPQYLYPYLTDVDGIFVLQVRRGSAPRRLTAEVE